MFSKQAKHDKDTVTLRGALWEMLDAVGVEVRSEIMFNLGTRSWAEVYDIVDLKLTGNPIEERKSPKRDDKIEEHRVSELMGDLVQLSRLRN